MSNAMSEPKFVPLSSDRQRQLEKALRANADQGTALLMDPSDTTFAGSGEVSDDEVIGAIRSVPCHYSGTPKSSDEDEDEDEDFDDDEDDDLDDDEDDDFDDDDFDDDDDDLLDDDEDEDEDDEDDEDDD